MNRAKKWPLRPSVRGLIIALMATISPAAASPARPPAASASLPFRDKGIFSDLSPQVKLTVPRWLAPGPMVTVRVDSWPASLLLVDGIPVAPAPATTKPTITLTAWPDDADGDGIPTTLDILIGAKKTVLNQATYRNRYHRIPYPGGDVPRAEGVCTDVIIRSLRNAGYDLQQLLQQDIRRARRAYPMVKRPDPNIDHRRVRTVLPFFQRHWRALPRDPHGRRSPLLPGDIVFLNTMGDARPDHIGIISDQLGRSGLPLVINNWTEGYRTTEMDLLAFVPMTHRFRFPQPPLPLAPAQRGPQGLLARYHLRLPEQSRQALVVTSVLWSSNGGELRRYVRGGTPQGAAGTWRSVGPPFPVYLGAAGLGWGRGLASAAPLRQRTDPVKKEGDKRSPAGVFWLGQAFGRAKKRPYAPAPWPWRATDQHDVFVDDPSSRFYNTWQRPTPQSKPSWGSAERLASYEIALVVQHNVQPVKPGAGSAIFLHPDDHPSVGCTTMSRSALLTLLRWLDPAAKPVLIQLPGSIF